MGLGKRQVSADCEAGRKGARLCAPTGVALDSRGGFETRPYENRQRGPEGEGELKDPAFETGAVDTQCSWC